MLSQKEDDVLIFSYSIVKGDVIEVKKFEREVMYIRRRCWLIDLKI